MSLRDLSTTIRGNEHPLGLGLALHHDHPPGYHRHVFALNAGGNRTPTVNRVYLTPFVVWYPMTIDQLIYSKGSAVAGNVRGCIYESINDLPDGGQLLADSGPIAMSPGVNIKQALDLPDTRLDPALYYCGFQWSDAGARYLDCGTRTQRGDPPNGRYYTPGAFALTDPCPATLSYYIHPAALLRILSVP